MSFFILLLIAVLLFISLVKYRRIYSVALSAGGILGTTTAVLMLGLWSYTRTNSIVFFSDEIPERGFLHMIAVWYAVDAGCIAIIIRNFLEYRKVNRK